MDNVLGYEGRNVVVTGAASGMGSAAAKLLTKLGAKVYALDIADVLADVTQAIKLDMRDQDTLDAAAAALPDEVHALFNCAGVPSPPFAADDTVMINFSGLRYLTEAILPRMAAGSAIASIASTAGMGWRPKLDDVREFLALPNELAAARQWLSENPERCADGYGFSKQCIIVYTMERAAELAQRGIRINAISPSPTDSAFMDILKGEGQMPDEAIDLFLPPHGQYGSGADMGNPLVFLNSALAGFISGVNLPVDYGYCAQLYMQQRDDLLGITA